MKNKIFKRTVYFLLDKCLSIISFFIPVKKNKVAFIKKSDSGSNSNVIYKILKETHPELKAVLLDISKQGSGFNWLKSKLSLYKQLMTSRMIVSTHGAPLKTHKNITFDLWHAFPTKKAGLLLGSKGDDIVTSNIDYFLSYSEFGTLLLNSRYGEKGSKYIALGSPRNDYLFEQMKLPFSFLSNHKDCKVVYFLPTYREQEKDEITKMQKLRFSSFDFERFNSFLQKNKIVFVLKFHPNDEKKWWEALKDLKYSNILLLKNEFLEDGFEDFYQILPFSDLMITDYSSSYVDYLLLDKPMIFTPTDIEDYNKERGLLLEPYDFWRPGPKCITQESLEKELLKSLNEKQYFSKERKEIREIFHKYLDGKSTERIVEFITSKLKQE